MVKEENALKGSGGIWLPLIAVCLAILTGLFGYDMYVDRQVEGCRQLSLEPTLVVKATNSRWSFSDGCEIQVIWSHDRQNPKWTPEWLFRDVHLRSNY